MLRKLAFSIDFKGDSKPIEKMDGATNKLKDSAEKTSKQLKSMGESASKLGKSLTTKVTLPLAGLATEGTKMALDLQQGIKKVTTLADGDILPVSKIQKEVRAISDASGIMQTEISDAVYDSLSAGIDSSKVMEFVRSGIDLTRAGFTDMETAIDATTTVLNAYGDDAFEISKIHDIFVQTQDKGKISVDELGKSIGRVIPTASSLGVNMDQLGASYAILTAKGQNAQLATTNLNSMLDEMGKTGSAVDKVLRKKTGKGFQQLTKDGKSMGEILGIVDESAKASGLSLKDMFGSGTAGSAAVTLLSDGVDGFNKSLDDMNNSTGKTAENAKTMEDGWLKIQKATTQVKNALIDAGAVIAPYVEMGAEKISQLVDGFNSLDDGTKNSIMKFMGLAAVIGPVLLGIGKVVSIVGTVIGIGGKLVGGISAIIGVVSNVAFAFSAVAGGAATLAEGMLLVMGPVGWAIAAVGALTVAGIALYKNWDTVKEKAGQLKDRVVSAWQGMSTTTKIIVSAIVAGPIGGLIAGGVALYRNWDTVKDKTSEAWDSMKAKIEGGVNEIKDYWRGLKTFLKNPIKGTVNIFKKDKGDVSAADNIDGSHYSGLAKVPFDGYRAELHKNEEILRADDPRNQNNATTRTPTSSTKDGNSGIVFSPVYNIEISGTATESDRQDFEKVAKKVSREMFNEFFMEMNMKLA